MGLLRGRRGRCCPSLQVLEASLKLLACGFSVSKYRTFLDIDRLTVIALGNSVLDASPLRQIRNFGPVLIRVGIGAECATRAVAGGEPRPSRRLVRIGISICAMHGEKDPVTEDEGEEEEEERSQKSQGTKARAEQAGRRRCGIYKG